MPVAKENPWKKKKPPAPKLTGLAKLKYEQQLKKIPKLKIGDNVKLEWPRNGAYETIPRNFVGTITEIRGANGEFITAKSRFDVTYDGYLPSLKVTKLKRL